MTKRSHHRTPRCCPRDAVLVTAVVLVGLRPPGSGHYGPARFAPSLRTRVAAVQQATYPGGAQGFWWLD